MGFNLRTAGNKTLPPGLDILRVCAHTIRGTNFTCFHASLKEGGTRYRLEPPDVPLPARGKLFLRGLLRSAGLEMSLNVVPPSKGVLFLHKHRVLLPAGRCFKCPSIGTPIRTVVGRVGSGGGLCGFLEAFGRPMADGCTTQPVGYVAGWYLDPDVWQRGVGRALVQAAESWAVSHGCREMASDIHLDNSTSTTVLMVIGGSGRKPWSRRDFGAKPSTPPDPVEVTLTQQALTTSVAQCCLGLG
jgi:hypothetical protein